MTDTTSAAAGPPTFGRVALVAESPRAMNILTGSAVLGRVTEGVLRVTAPGTLEWTAPGEIVTLRGITFADLVRPGMIGVDHQGESGPAVAVLVDRSKGQRGQIAATAAMAPILRAALGLPAKTTEELDADADAAVKRAEAKMRSARIRMAVSGVVCAGGAIATAIGYSNAKPGSSYTLWWGAIVFGLLWFVVGAAEYAGASKEKTNARLPRQPSSAPTVPPPEPAAVAAGVAEPLPPPPAPEPVVPEPLPPPPAPSLESDGDAVLGLRFHIDQLGEDYRSDAWRVVWTAIDPAQVGPARLREGDTAATLAGRERAFCIAVEARSSAVTRLREALSASPEFLRVAADPVFVTGEAVTLEPLTSAGSVGEHGELDARAPMIGLNAARERPRPTGAPAFAPAATHRGLPRSQLILIGAVVIVLIGAALWFTVGRDDRTAPVARASVSLDEQARALVGDIDLTTFGSPRVEDVTCPAGSAAQKQFDCAVALSGGADATMTVAVRESGALEWCSFVSRGDAVFNLPEIGSTCAVGGTTRPSTSFVPTSILQRTTTPFTGSAPVSHEIDTSAGPVPIVEVSLTDEYPAGCTPSDVGGCQRVTGNRLVLVVVGPAPGRSGQATMDAINDEFFESVVHDSAGGQAFARQISRLRGGDTIDLVFDSLSVENPTSLVLVWPGASAISLDF